MKRDVLSIAILGGACRFPSASSFGDVAAILQSGSDAVRETLPHRWVHERFLHPRVRTPGAAYTFSAGLIENHDQFDHGLFGISPREAVQMDPQQHLLLELTHEALEDAGIAPAAVAGQRVGVYVGISFIDHANKRGADLASIDGYFVTGAAVSVVANRISHAFDFRGPSLSVDTACSSSVVALHLACNALRSGEVDTAIVGGVNMLLDPMAFVGFSQATMLSPTGRCRPFSAQADGFMRSEGAAVVVLRRQDMVGANDRPRGWVLASGVNSDGHTNGLSLPNPEAQARLLREVYDAAGINPQELDYFEAHGTGTAVGDPIETSAIGAALTVRRTTALPISSAKSSFGHLEAASGMAGLFAALTVLERRQLPKLAHFEAPNPAIDFEALRLAPSTESRKLAPEGRLLVGLNSFGFGGTNAHAILSNQPATARLAQRTGRQAKAAKALPPLVLSARSSGALEALADRWAAYLDTATAEALPAALRGAASGRGLYQHRLVARGAGGSAIAQSLRDWRAGERNLEVTVGHAAGGGIAFVFGGNGSQWAGMGCLAFRKNADFRAAIRHVSDRLQSRLGWSLADELIAANPARLRRTDIAQPLLFAVQYALVVALGKSGIRPDVVMGHSVGEIAAAWAAGVLDLDTALDVLICRSELQHRTRGEGRMAVCAIDVAAAERLIAEHELALDIAAYNGARAITLTGPAADIAAFRLLAEAQGQYFVELDLDYAFHSRLLDPIGKEMVARLDGIRWNPPELKFISTVTGKREAAPTLDADYWWHNLRAPVRFSDAARAVAGLDVGLLLEIGPQPVLQSYLNEIRNADGRTRQVMATLSQSQMEGDPLAAILAACHVNGADITRAPIFEGPREMRGLPHYPYQRQSVGIVPSIESRHYVELPRAHPLLGFPVGDQGLEWRAHVDLDLVPWLADHVVDEDVVVAGMALVDMALAAARSRFPDAAVLDVIDFEISRPLVITPGNTRELRLRIEPERDRIEISSRPRLARVPWTIHATGRMTAAQAQPPQPLPSGAGRPMGADAVYAHAESLHLFYGPEFRKLTGLTVHDDNNCTVLLAPADGAHAARFAAGVVLDPAWTDSILHGLLSLPFAASQRMLPTRFGRVRLFGGLGEVPAVARIQVGRSGPNAIEGSVVVLDAAGRVVCELSELWFTRAAAVSGAATPGHWITAQVPQARPLQTALPPAPTHMPQTSETADAMLLLDACIAQAAHEAVLSLCNSGLIEPDLLLATRAIPRDTEKLLLYVLEILTQDGLASRDGEGWTLAPAGDLADWREIWRSLLAEMPDSVGELAQIGAVLEDLPQALRTGGSDALAGARALREQMLTDGPDGNRLIEALAADVATILAAVPPQRALRVLEIGPHAGRVTRALRRRLATVPQGLVCTIAVPDGEAAEDALAALGWLPGRAIGWDLSDANSASLPAGGFDLVIGVYCGMQGAAPAETARRIAALLAPGGRMLLAEPRQERLWRLLYPASMAATQARWVDAICDADLRPGAIGAVSGQLWSSVMLQATRPEAPASIPIPPAAPVVVAAGVADTLANTLADRLAVAGSSVERCAIGALTLTAGAPRPIALLLAGDPEDPTPRLAELAAFASALAASGHADLVLVTRGEATGEPAAQALETALRAIANENPDLAWRTLRLSRQFDDAAAAAAIIASLDDGGAEAELLLSPDGRLAPRVRPAVAATTDAGSAKLEIGVRGRLDTLTWKAVPMPVAGPGEVVIETEAAGLNFRDVMWSLGMLPDEALIDGFAGVTLGLECAGRIAMVGEGVTRFSPGQRVVALAPASFSTHARTLEDACLALPDDFGFAGATTLPVTFMTVCHGLGTLAQLGAGETVLIHGAAGGVGLAAVQYALHRKAVVIATAGSPAKRALLRLLGVPHVFDSRSLDFADAALQLTNGRGVDVVLNSLSGKAMERSLEIVAPLGRFVELGKRDFLADTSVGLRPLRRNVSYFGVDVDSLAKLCPDRMRVLFDEIGDLLASGAIRPLPYRAMGYDAAEDAFRVMRGSGHVGKLVLSRAHGMPRINVPPPRFAADPDGCYVITGGLAGFGLEAVHWLAGRGARHLALISRRGVDTPGAAEALAELAAAGCKVQVVACDVSERDALAAALCAIRRWEGPIVGVLHAAMVLRDGLSAGMDEASFRAVLAPKYQGAVWLDELTADDPVSLFLVFSSVSAMLANPGQVNYAAANAGIEAIVERRRAAGRAGIAIAWGPIADAGVLSREGETAQLLSRRLGNQAIAARQALESLDIMLALPAPMVAAASVRWSEARGALRGLASARFSEMLDGGGNPNTQAAGDLRTDLAALPYDEALDRVRTMLSETLAGTLRLPASAVGPDTRLNEIGLDSLMGVELHMAIEARFGVSVSVSVIAEQSTLTGMAMAILGQMVGAASEHRELLDEMALQFEGTAAVVEMLSV